MIESSRDLVAIQDYLVGRLSDDARDAFEERLAREPQFVREFEQYLQMCEGLRLNDMPRARAAHVTRRWKFALIPTALAATLACIALGSVSWVQRSITPPGSLVATPLLLSTPAASPQVAAHFTFVSLRGGLTPDLVLPVSGLIEFRAAPPARSADSQYRLTLLRAQPSSGSLAPLGALGSLTADAAGYVHVYADGSRLTPGAYVLRIEPESKDLQTDETYRFNLRAPVNAPTR
jgi:hypothetical protein